MKNYILALLALITIKLNCQEIINYDFNVNIDVAQKKVHVDGTISVDFKNADSISFVLWKNSIINSISVNNSEVKYSFDTLTSSPIFYIPNGRKLIISRPAGSNGTQNIKINYECNMKELNGWASSFTEDWVEINFYSAWFPVNGASKNSTLRIKTNEGFNITGSGLMHKENDYWVMRQPWTSFDNVIITSKNLKTKSIKENNNYIETSYSEFSESGADSILTECKFAVDYFQTLFGKKDSIYMKFVVAPFEGGGYSRKNFVSMRTKQFNLHTYTGIGHELAHFWWSNAPAYNWEDWLNESFAEYSMMLYLKKRLGNEVFNKRVEQYKNDIKNTPPIEGIDRNAPEAYTVLYEKGALILLELDQKIGNNTFVEFLKALVTKKVSSTNDLLELLELNTSKETRLWLEQKLKS